MNYLDVTFGTRKTATFSEQMTDAYAIIAWDDDQGVRHHKILNIALVQQDKAPTMTVALGDKPILSLSSDEMGA